MQNNYYDNRCPCCKKLLLKISKESVFTGHIKSCDQCEKEIDCRICDDKKCLEFDSVHDGNEKCPKCTLEIACDHCTRFYYRAWMMEKERRIEVKCPKCKKIVTLK